MNYQNGSGIPPTYHPPPYPQYSPEPWYRPIRRNANIVCFGLFVVLLLGIFLMPVFKWVADFFILAAEIDDTDVLSLIHMTCELFATCLMLVIPIIIMCLWIGIPSSAAFPMRRPRMSIAVPGVCICLGVSVVGSLIYGVIVALIQTFFGVAPYMPAFSTPTGIAGLIIYFLRVVLVPSIFEELMFRGVIMQSLRRFGDMFALVCSSILFSLAHRNIAQGISALIVGITIGFFVLRTGSLRTGMLIHFVNNGISVTADYISKNMPSTEAQIFTALQFGFYILSGAAGLIYLLVAHSKIFHLAPSGYPVPEKRKYSLFFFTVMPFIYIATILVFTLMNFG